ncbi:MAG TPA: thiamine diphosphokinase [Candidatus Polarisedimenticolaceae bacterium]|nr:thiamine diphosphokinase [Candidatus Polarisedimenticolaceae bacterium]
MHDWGERTHLELRGLRRRGRVVGAVVVLHGAGAAELRRAAALAALLADRCLLVAVDGGLRTCQATGRRPDLFVGDGDSARQVPESMPAVRFPQDKDFSDLAGALPELRKRLVQVVVVAGLLGGRLDHEWANLFELGASARGFAALLAPSRRGTVLITGRGCRAATVPGRVFSLLPLGGPATVTLNGTRWELARRRLRPGSHGLSNRTGTELDLTVHNGIVALVFPPGPVRRRRGSAGVGL